MVVAPEESAHLRFRLLLILQLAVAGVPDTDGLVG